MTGYRRNSIRDVRDSPYVYGLDISSNTILHKMYKDKYDINTPYSVCVLDIESDVETKIITAISIVMGKDVFTAVTKKLVGNITDVENKVKKLFVENIPESAKGDVNIKVEVHDTAMSCIEAVFKVLHIWKPDILAIWNILFDIPMIVAECNRNEIDPKNIFSDPSIPEHLREFKIKEGPKQSVKESGLVVPINIQDQWHTIYTTSSFYIIDAMCAYSYVRAGANAVIGGYSLDNILKHELNLGKLTFKDMPDLIGVEWHNYMSKNKPLEYIVYNQWDCLGMVELDKKTTDLSTNMPVLNGYSSFDKFSSGPKKIVDALYFYALDNGKVIGSKPNKASDDKILGLDNWIITLEAFRIVDNGLNVIKDNPDILTNIRSHVYDADQVSGYPSNTVAVNLSKETTKREIKSVAGIPKHKFKVNNMNLMYGSVNSISYCTEMLRFPTLVELNEKIKIA